MPSSGKSTLMRILAVWAARRGLKTTLVVDNIASVLELCAFLERLGLSATPILGARSREGQLEKVHFLLQDQGLDLAGAIELKWLSTVCALNGLRSDTTIHPPFRPGSEPCAELYASNPRHEAGRKPAGLFCPIFPVCPVHRVAQSLPHSSVWVATLASLIHTWVPVQLVNAKMRYWELVYRHSDLVIFDEADRVQVLLDGFFAPTQNLVDHTGQSWLNRLGASIGSTFYGGGRRQLYSPAAMSWYRAYENVQRTVDRVTVSCLATKKSGNGLGIITLPPGAWRIGWSRKFTEVILSLKHPKP